MRESPAISICVSVYNAEPYLARFIESAINQTFDNYEIILVDNCSTDHSLDIMYRFRECFPEKVFVYKLNDHGNAGKGRNYAFQNSKGSYIYWCDGDDIIHPKALSVLYDAAIKQSADIVRGYGIRMDEVDGDIIKLSPYSRHASGVVSTETAIMTAGTYFWLELIRRDLIEKYGPMPEEFILEDIRYLAPLHSYASKIFYVDFPIYFWSRRGESTTFTVRKELCVDAAAAPDYVMDHCNPNYKKAIQYMLAEKIVGHSDIYWQFYDLFVESAKKKNHWIYQNELLKKNTKLLKSFCHLCNLPENKVPNIVYVDGFSESPTPERLTELKSKVFHDGCEVIILSPETCNVLENEYIGQAYKSCDKGICYAQADPQL